MSIDYIEVALRILSRLEMEYKYASAKAVDKPEMVRFLSEQLNRLPDDYVMCWNEALNEISDKGGKHPPTIPEILYEIRRAGIATMPVPIKIEEKEVSFPIFWKGETEEQKLEDTKSWLRFCPKDMPTIMLDWVKNQEEETKDKLRLIKKSNILKGLNEN